MGTETSLGVASSGLLRTLEELIESGAVLPGERLPAERQLADQYAVSRATVRRALANLEQRGLVRRRVGRSGGTTVTVPGAVTAAGQGRKVLRRPGVGVPQFLRQQGFTVGTQVLSAALTPASPRAAEQLGTSEGELLVVIRRIRLADAAAISLEVASFPWDVVPDLLSGPLDGSLYQLLEERGRAIEEVSETVEVTPADPEAAALLGVHPGAALLTLERVGRDATGAAVEYSVDHFRADRTRLYVESSQHGVRGRLKEGAPAPRTRG